MSMRYKGGVISATSPTVTPPVDGEGGSASGIWSLKTQAQYAGSGEWPKPILDKELYSSGKGLYGALGTSSIVNTSSPVQIGAETIWNALSTNFETAMATKTDGTLWYWGRGNGGRSGTGTENPATKSSPVQIGALTNWSIIRVMAEDCVAVKTDGTFWSWGTNSYGQLGQNNKTNYFSPVQVGSLTTWSTVATSLNDGVFALKTDGTLWSWGKGGSSQGQLGHSDEVYRSSPVQIGSDTWSYIAAGNTTVGGIKTSGSLWMWGNGGNGALGDGYEENASSPIQVGALTTWASLAVGLKAALAIKTDGTLWAWGLNSKGPLGINSTINKSSPVQVGAQTTWKKPSVGRYSSIVTKTDGTMWSWGANAQGELGRTNLAYNSSPIQVGAATNWGFATSTQDEGSSLFRTG